MLKVKTYIAPSPIHGIGLFAAEPIGRHTVIWWLALGLCDRLVSDPGVLLPPYSEYVQHHAYVCQELKTRIMPGDNARFMNHKPTPKPNSITGYKFTPEEDWPTVKSLSASLDIAARDIKVGEELTIDYATFDLEYQIKITPREFVDTNVQLQELPPIQDANAQPHSVRTTF